VQTAARLTQERLLCDVMNMERGITRRKDYCISSEMGDIHQKCFELKPAISREYLKKKRPCIVCRLLTVLLIKVMGVSCCHDHVRPSVRLSVGLSSTYAILMMVGTPSLPCTINVNAQLMSDRRNKPAIYDKTSTSNIHRLDN